MLRTQAQAEYSVENYGHFGLNLRRYAHFTSPIRRYADLIVHRALISALHLGSDGSASIANEELAEIAAKISATERRAMAAERETSERLIAAHLAGQIGAVFQGRISGATSAGLFVKLDETGADGFIPAAMLGDDYFRHDPARHALIGSRTGQMHRLGDIVSVRLVEVAPLAGALRFELESETAPRQTRPTSAKGKRRPVATSNPISNCHIRGELIVGPRIVKRVACRRRRDDVDNIKALLDALSGILWLDDGQIADFCISKATTQTGHGSSYPSNSLVGSEASHFPSTASLSAISNIASSGVAAGIIIAVFAMASTSGHAIHLPCST